MANFKEIFNKTSFKFVAGFSVIILIGLIVFLLTNSYFLKPDYWKAKKYLEEMQEKYENDIYGGKTPEETLNMFIAALEAGDVELASKYFVIDRQEEWLEELSKEKNIDGNFNNLISGLENLEKTGDLNNNTEAFFVLTNKDNVVVGHVLLNKNQNNIWKIEDL